jgi:hypothetical protein
MKQEKRLCSKGDCKADWRLDKEIDQIDKNRSSKCEGIWFNYRRLLQHN